MASYKGLDDLARKKVAQYVSPPSEEEIDLDESQKPHTEDLVEDQIQEPEVEKLSTDSIQSADEISLKEHQERLKESREYVQFLQHDLNRLSFRRQKVLVLIIPAFVTVLVILAVLPELLRNTSFFWFFDMGIWWLFKASYSPSITLCLMLICVVLPTYYFMYSAPINFVKKSLWRANADLETLEVFTPNGRKEFLNEKLRFLTKKAAQVFFESPERREQARLWRRASA